MMVDEEELELYIEAVEQRDGLHLIKVRGDKQGSATSRVRSIRYLACHKAGDSIIKDPNERERAEYDSATRKTGCCAKMNIFFLRDGSIEVRYDLRHNHPLSEPK